MWLFLFLLSSVAYSVDTCYGTWANSTLVCSGHGECVATDACNCTIGYSELQCQVFQCFNTTCANHGTCVGINTCECDLGFEGVTCTPSPRPVNWLVISIMTGSFSLLLCLTLCIIVSLLWMTHISHRPPIRIGKRAKKGRPSAKKYDKIDDHIGGIEEDSDKQVEEELNELEDEIKETNDV